MYIVCSTVLLYGIREIKYRKDMYVVQCFYTVLERLNTEGTCILYVVQCFYTVLERLNTERTCM